MSRPERQRPGAVSAIASATRLTPQVEKLHVGDTAPAPKPAAADKPKRVPFGSYLPPDLQRQFKAQCVLQGIEMQDALEQAIRAWLNENGS